MDTSRVDGVEDERAVNLISTQAFDVDGDRTLDYDELVYCISMRARGVLRCFHFLVMISRGRGWFLFGFRGDSDRVERLPRIASEFTQNQTRNHPRPRLMDTIPDDDASMA